jgi:RNA polymerase sigma-70 factor, ECF subfamily
MPKSGDQDTEMLLERASHGDPGAVDELLQRHRQRLRQMVAVRIDPRLKARVDPSDVVQDALLEAARMLPEYLRHRPLPYYPWLRQIAWQRLYDLHVRHVQTQGRSVTREAHLDMELSDDSLMHLAKQLVASNTSPSMHVVRDELRHRVRQALEQIKDADREVLLLRYLEQLSAKEIAAVVGTTEAAVNMRHLRALKRLQELLGNQGESTP